MPPKLIQFFTHDRPVGVVISLNALVLFLLSFPDLAHQHWLGMLDALFLFYFMIEAFTKIRLLGWQEYRASGWNRFDFLILILSIPSVVLLFQTQESNYTFIFVFRIIRVIRFFKFIRFIPNIQELIAGIQRAFKASVFVLLAFFVYSFIISLISCRLFQAYAPNLFGDPVTSFYHIFRVFTIEGWYEIPEEVIRESGMVGASSFLTRFYFIVIVISGGLFGLSIVNAIFVEEMVRDNNDDIVDKILEMERKIDQLLVQTVRPSESLPVSESIPPEEEGNQDA
jgi:voltage-gated sodium channel